MKPERTTQEFYCGACDGYFLAHVNRAINHEIIVRCPNCRHEHRRVVKEGTIYEDGRYSSDVKETLITTQATYSKESRTEMKCMRGGNPLTPEQRLRWLEVAERERSGAMFDD